jgi:hypothetical protein
MCPPLLALIPAIASLAGAAGIAGGTAGAVGAMSTGTALMSLAGAGLSSVGAVAGAQAQQAGYERQADQYRTQAELLNRQANVEQDAGQYQQRKMQEKGAAVSAKQRVITAGSGFSIDGSPSDVVIDSRRENAMDVAAIKYSTDLKSDNLNFQSGVAGSNAQASDRAASTAGMTGIFSSIAPFIQLGGNEKFTTRLGLNF